MKLSYTNPARIDALFEKQKDFFRSGATKSIEFRKKALATLKQLVLDHQDEICTALNNDLGKPAEVSKRAEIQNLIHDIDHISEHLAEWAQVEEMPTPAMLQPSRTYVAHEPYGVSYIIGPFNYPFLLALDPLVGAIAGGNTAIVKPSETVPHTAALIERLLNDAFDEGYIAVVQGGIEENTHLLGLDFDFYFFTGSPGVGKVVMRAAAEHLAPVVLELGGKSPFIVLPDADLERTVDRLVDGKFQNSGQTCIAPDYVYVHKDIKEALVDKLVERVRHTLPDVDSTGKLVTREKVESLKKLLDATRGKVLIGGHCEPAIRAFAATVVDDVEWDDALMTIELFAPILPILSFDSLDEAISKVNAEHPNPLACYVFTKDTARGEAILSEIPAGDGQVNDVITHVASTYLPFGGLKGSGMGEYHGYYSFQAFTHRKSIRVVD